MPNKQPAFEARDLSRSFGHGDRRIKAVDNVSLTIQDQEIVTIVGGSSCGKSVLAKTLLGLIPPTSGELLYRGKPITDQRSHWRDVQPVFQDPFSCFNQFFKIRSQLRSSFGIYKKKPSKDEIEVRVDEGLRAVNIVPSEIEGKYPFELSGGQMQRMLLARVFILRPRVLIADEPTSMVDACVRANILDYLMKLKKELKMTIVFITHDIGLACYVSDRIFIMHAGKIVEGGPPDEITGAPKNQHTIQLLEDVPHLHKEWIAR
ncbi:MAG: dipeptide/oligopeptide/nickel ABC transporter ATP-binding protein [Nannocystaceae bacterium]